MPGKAVLVFARFAGNFGMWETHGTTPHADCPAMLVGLHGLWAAKARPGRHADADALALDRLPRALADHCALVDLRWGIPQARYTHVGNTLVKLYGAPLAGRHLSAVYSGNVLAEVRGAYARLMEADGPLFTERTFRVFDAKLGYHRLLLPLSGEGRRVSHALLGLVPKGNVRSAIDWRTLEAELALADLVGEERHGTGP
ncbi:hypothetical protein HHL28_00765 [Aerophototrophica crusticola]|uniref:PAS domain-containing protein n=1 Tax=Aerophototrophica crusticola TaxID=1709002 RepID=A0A858R378_9PROT|nr:hypothetical protein HHL28_00765 [Rhodospirillaceae bacterium B3]